MSDRASTWSITINNPVEADYKLDLPAGWVLEGQLEKGDQGTVHYQGMLKTPQVRFSAVKRIFGRAHIEIARNVAGLRKYVHKEESRVAVVETNRSEIPTLWDYQKTIANRWDQKEFARRLKFNDWIENGKGPAPDSGEVALAYVDDLVRVDIENGVRGVEFIAINPMWRSSWKKFYRSIIKRDGVQTQGTQDASQAQQATSSPSDSQSGAGRSRSSSFSGDDATD